jgi:hypothetical protein
VVTACEHDFSRPHETLDFIVADSILAVEYSQLLNGKLLCCVLRQGGNVWQAKIEGLVECSFTGHAFYVVTADGLFAGGSSFRFNSSLP